MVPNKEIVLRNQNKCFPLKRKSKKSMLATFIYIFKKIQEKLVSYEKLQIWDKEQLSSDDRHN